MASDKTAQAPWERQQGESEQAWEAFLTYRDMDPPRKVQAVASKLSKSRQQITKWKSAWSWEERARAYDNQIDREVKEKVVDDRQEMRERHIYIAKSLQKKALDALKNLRPEDMSPRDIKEYFRLATELERLTSDIVLEERKEIESAANSLEETIIAAYRKRRGGDA